MNKCNHNHNQQKNQDERSFLYLPDASECPQRKSGYVSGVRNGACADEEKNRRGIMGIKKREVKILISIQVIP